MATVCQWMVTLGDYIDHTPSLVAMGSALTALPWGLALANPRHH